MQPSMRESLTSEALLQRAAALCREKRGQDLVALDVRGLVDYMDFLLLCTGRSDRQNRAIAEHVIRGVKQAGCIPLSRAGIEAGEWICIDLVDVVVHVFTPELRRHYDLELLWADAAPVHLVEPEAAEATEERSA
jgi:ribosome-associated protein